MKTLENESHKRPKKPKYLDLRDVNSCLRYTPKLLEEFRARIDALPRVDEEGYSECHFAENLFAEKEKVAEKVVAKVEELRRCVDFLDGEIAKFRQNLAKIQADANSLHSDRAKEKYLSAQQSQESLIEKYVQLAKALLDLISQAEKLLALAQGKKWPLGEPKEAFHPPPAMVGGPVDSRASSLNSPKRVGPSVPRPSLKTEIDSLMSLGPLGKKNT